MDKFKATWISHSSMRDFLNCPRLYYLRNIYKNPKTKNKITIVTPALALGQAVHDTVENLSNISVSERFQFPFIRDYEKNWKKIEGEKGGFKSKDQEDEYYTRGKQMIERVVNNPGPIANKALKLKDDFIPHYIFNEEEEIILSGKIDWIEYIEKNDSVHIIDFKTGKGNEDNSMQLPIYLLLATNLQKRQVEKLSYWYLDRDNEPTTQIMPDPKKAYEEIFKVAKRIKLARKLEHFSCPKNGCKHCIPFEEVVAGKGKKVSETSYQDVFIV